MEKNFTRKVGYRKIVRRWLLQGVIAMVFCGVAVAHGKYAQLLEKKVTLKFVDAPLEVVLHAIEQQAGIRFFYSRDRVDLDEQVSVQAEDKLLKDVFRELFGSLRIRYFIHDKESTVTLKRQKQAEETGQGVPEDRNIQLAPAAVRVTSVSGVVTDAQSQQALAGVNVVVKGTLRGTSTDADGKYSIEVDDDKDILVFSFIGFKTVEVPVGGRTIIDTSLEEDISRLREVTVSTGYWEVDKKYSTGNISKVTSKEIENQPVNNPILALQGRVAGLNIEQVSGVPGGSFRRLQIRGQNSLRADGNDPLFVINGVPYPSQNLSKLSANGIFPSLLNILNPSDIESIEVLKDADATAVYGSLGANGVVLITTKEAKGKDTSVDFNFYTGFGDIPGRVDLLNTQQYLEMRNEAFTNDGAVPNQNNAPDLVLWDNSRYTDWQKELIGGTAHLTNAYVSVSGGSERTRILAGGGYLRETTVFPGNFPYQKGSINLSGTHTSNDQKFNASFKTNLARENSTLPFGDLTGQALALSPNAPRPFQEDGELNWENGTWLNPYAALLKVYDGKTTLILNSLELDYELLPGLKLHNSAGYNLTLNNVTRTAPLSSYSPTEEATGELQLSKNEFQTWTLEPKVSYKKFFGRGTMDVLAGGTLRETNTSGTLVTATGFASDAVIHDIRAATNINFAEDNFTSYRYAAFYGRLAFNWDSKYFINISGRRDGSSRFGIENRFANFGAIGAAWVFSKERFLEGQSFMSFGKIKASYGTLGNDQIGDYEYLSTYGSVGAKYQNENPLYPIRLGNAAYQWEVVRKLEFGVELSFFKDRLNLNSYFYQNRSSNQLVEYSLPAATGFTEITANLDAEIRNQGFEFELSTQNVSRRNFKWTTSFNITLPSNKLVKFPNLEGSNYADYYRVGQPLYIILVYKYKGINEQGLYDFQDIDGDGEISNPNDAQEIVDLSKKFYGGFQNSLTYKGFALDFLFQFVNQPVQNHTDVFNEAPGRISNQPLDVTNRWTNGATVTSVQKYTQGGTGSSTYSNYQFSDVAYTDGAFVRLKNISFSYNLPSTILKKAGIANCRIYMQAQNLFTITGYKFLDPETRGSLPPVRMITTGIQLTL